MNAAPIRTEREREMTTPEDRRHVLLCLLAGVATNPNVRERYELALELLAEWSEDAEIRGAVVALSARPENAKSPGS